MPLLLAVRHLISIAILPGVVVAVVPIWIARRYSVELQAPAGSIDFLLIALGVASLAIGVVLFIASLRRFVTDGNGTLAPWDPPRRLVVRGPYRYVRNPMISGVIFLLAAEAALLRSAPHAIWAAIFAGLNVIYIPILEEPMLEERFGEDYAEYRRHVRRFVPRLRPWDAKGIT
jgi:protein-S-isoprenylcysteine O-methyltransferase Ste14